MIGKKLLETGGKFHRLLSSKTPRNLVANKFLVNNIRFNPVIWSSTAKYLSNVASSLSIKKAQQPEQHEILNVRCTERYLNVEFEDHIVSDYPYVWLRENCTCEKCFNASAIARLFLVEQLQIDIKPINTEVENRVIRVEWNDGHVSELKSEWLRQRAFTDEARKKYRQKHILEQVLWTSDFQIPVLDFNEVMKDDMKLLEWIIYVEKYGIVQTNNCPKKDGPMKDLINRIGFAKPTHYGTWHEIVINHTPNNLANTGHKLALHTDLPYYDYVPGTTWFQCISQHIGEGGANTLMDGFKGVEILRQTRPDLFEALTTYKVYFQDKGYHLYDFDKLTKKPIISTDKNGRVTRINSASQSRDSYMDLTADEVYRFYEALKEFDVILNNNKLTVKIQPGEMIILDNLRVMHGRTPFVVTKECCRHVANGYIDWDELRSKRRLLSDQFNVAPQ